ncbi:MAG TPA: hypothetical protein VF808_18420 [Ktedonobacterales bacterium]
MTAVFYIVCVILFWAALFVFAFWTTVATLKVPTEAELEHAAAEADHHSAASAS